MDQQIKERMIGAGVLVLAAVIFIPMLLSGPTPQHAELISRAGGKSAGASGTDSAQARAERGFSSRIVPLGSSAPTPPSTSAPRMADNKVGEGPSLPTTAIAVDKSPAPTGDSGSPAKLQKKSQPPATAKPKPEPESGVKPAPPIATKDVRKSIATQSNANATGGWVVQLGSFSSARNAHALRDRLNSKGYKAFARSSGSGAQAVTRVYVGPDASRERAQQRVSRLLAETRLKGIVIRNPQ